MKDRTGNEFVELVGMQQLHLMRIRDKLRPSVYADVREYCLKSNCEARTPEGKHQVFRGQDIVQLVLDHPQFNPSVYPPVAEEKAEEMI